MIRNYLVAGLIIVSISNFVIYILFVAALVRVYLK